MRLLALAVLVATVLPAQDVAVLGGPCQTNRAAVFDTWKAKKDRDWPRAVELERAAVRAGCDIAYRWEELADLLVQANRRAEAVQALEEMDKRGFEVNPSFIEGGRPKLAAFMATPMFRRSGIGIKVERLRRISDARRAKFAERLAKMPPESKPAEQYIARPACPGEYCWFGKWTVSADTELVAAPGSKEVVGRAQKGARVTAITGEMHLRPEPVGVLVDVGPLRRNSIVFVLDYLYEGTGHVWTAGKVAEVDFRYATYCFQPSADCWGEKILPSEEFKNTWWVKIRLPGGVVGWTDKTRNFAGRDVPS
jgi:hypothetical protein